MIINIQGTTLKESLNYAKELVKKGYNCFFKSIAGQVCLVAREN